MKRNLIKLTVFAFALVAFLACGKGGGTPEAVVEQYSKAIANHNWSKAKSLSTEDSHEIIDFMKNAAEGAKMFGEKLEKKPGKVENIDCEIEEDYCHCEFWLDGEYQEMELVNVNGKWLVDQKKESQGWGF